MTRGFLRFLRGNTVSIDSPKLSAIYVPFGSTGGATLAPASKATSNSSAK